MTPVLRAELERPRDNPSDGDIKAMAMAMWEQWRVSTIAQESFRDVSWERLVGLAIWWGKANLLMHAGLDQARVARRALFDKLLEGE